MSDKPTKTDQKQDVTLDECPFCHSGETFIIKRKLAYHFMLVHLPAKGVVCPARLEQVCDSVEQGQSWWNERSKKEGIK